MSNGRLIFGLVLITIGAFFVLDRFHIFNYFHFIDFWPLVLIVIGIALIIRHGKRDKREDHHTIEHQPLSGHKKYSQIFGDNNISAKDCEIDGLKCSTTFGDNTINLAGAKLNPGVNHLDISAVFGEITIIVPGDMEVSAYGSCTFGDLYILGQTASGISNSLQHQTENYDNASSKVAIWSSVTFGDVKIYRA